jgi:hypothetical protein
MKTKATTKLGKSRPASINRVARKAIRRDRTLEVFLPKRSATMPVGISMSIEVTWKTDSRRPIWTRFIPRQARYSIHMASETPKDDTKL